MTLAIEYMFLLQQPSSNCFNFAFYPAFHHSVPPGTTSSVLNHNAVVICVHFYSNRLRHIMKTRHSSVFITCVRVQGVWQN